MKTLETLAMVCEKLINTSKEVIASEIPRIPAFVLAIALKISKYSCRIPEESAICSRFCLRYVPR